MINNLTIMGRLTAEPEVTYTGADNIPLCKFSIAVNRPKRKDAEQETDFFNCVAWRGLAGVVSEYCHKGDLIVLIGSLKNSQYEKNGDKRVSTQIVVKEVHFTNSKKREYGDEEFPTSPNGFKMDDFETSEIEENFSDEGEPF